MNCRSCQEPLHHEFVDLGEMPPSNSFLTKEELERQELKFPLKVLVCEKCFLVQVDEYKKSNEIFSQDYAYFSSYSRSWLEHAKQYVEMIIKRLNLNQDSLVAELASNDGYLLQYFKKKGIAVYGVEPSKNVAAAAIDKGIETIVDFFGTNLAEELANQKKQVDLIVANNVLAHVPDINDFVKGMKFVLKPQGTITAEFPHLMKLIEENQFDTIYQEHYSYFSFHTIFGIFSRHGLNIYNVESLSTHGGSLRIYASHKEDSSKTVSKHVKELFDKESTQGMLDIEYYKGFGQKVKTVRDTLVSFLQKQKSLGKRIVGYGAAAKGNTLINYCGITDETIDFVVDASEFKQGKFLPQSHIQVVHEDQIKKNKPDYVLVLPWNLEREITTQLSYIRSWGGEFVIPIPHLKVL